MPDRDEVPRGVRSGVFLLSAAVLLFEVVLTRIFSVVFWYHFAFLAVSIALAGLAASGIVLHRQRARLAGRSPSSLLAGTLGFQVTAALAAALALGAGWHGNAPRLILLAPVYVAAALPFFSAGWSVGLAIGRWPWRAQSIYAADLAGAALGAVSAPLVLGWVDAAAAALVAAFLAALGGLAFTIGGSGRAKKLAAAGVLAAGLLVAVQVVLVPLHVHCPKGACEVDLTAERWNHFSRVAVFEKIVGSRAGMSDRYQGEYPTLRMMNIDAAAATPIMGFDGRDSSLEPFRWDLTSLPYRVRSPSSIFVAGAGGGPDLLTARAFGATSVTAAEINPAVVSMTEDVYGDYSGHPYRLPGVVLRLDDARSVLQSQDAHYDLVQMSLVDTFAAAAAGAFALTENSLYTTESFRLYLHKLAPGGLVSVSRWYRPSAPSEILRLVVLARHALEKEGINDPEEHILAAAWFGPTNAEHPEPSHRWGVALAMFSLTAFSPEERDRFLDACDTLGVLPLSPGRASSANSALGASPDVAVREALTRPDLDSWLAVQSANLTPPTDDWPFFFQATRLSRTSEDYLTGGVPVLMSLVLGTGALALVLLILARAVSGGQPTARGEATVAFALGLGFIVVEVGVLQRFLLLLGHPTYAMAVVLPSILLAAAVGSRAGAGFRLPNLPAWSCLAAAAAALLAAWALPYAIEAMVGEPRSLRIAFSVMVLFCIAFPMGIPFAALLRSSGEGTAWLWAVNGAASVFGSALAMLVSVFWGFGVSLSLGAAAYLLAAVLLGGLRQDAGQPDQSQEARAAGP